MSTHSILLNLLAVNASSITGLIIVLVLLFIVSFFLSGSEVAFFSLTSRDINVLKRKKQPSYRRIISLLEQPKTLKATLLIANLGVNMAIILIAYILLGNLNLVAGQTLNFVLKVLLLVVFLLLFAEVLPRVWATHHKVWFASSTSLLVEVFNSIFNRMGNRYVRQFESTERYFSNDRNQDSDQRNLDLAIDLMSEDEASKEEKQILKGIRKFGGITVKQVMRTRLDVSGLDIKLHFSELVKKAEEFHYSRLPVYHGNLDDIKGILHVKDLLPFLHEQDSYDWHTLLRPAYYVHEQKSIEDLLQEFRAKRIHFAVVVDEFGGTSGIVTLEDIIEEVTGDIKDEFDDEESINRKISDNEYVFEGKTMINDACKMMNLPISTFDEIRGDSDSMAGLVLEIAGSFPVVNEPVAWSDFEFTALDINRNRIEKIQLVIKQTHSNI